MKNKTKLIRLFEDPDKGFNMSNNTLVKVLRGFWRDLGLSHLNMNQLIDKWLEDPNNMTDDDKSKTLSNLKGNLRKDNERDTVTWHIFMRNLRLLRPKEIRILFKIKFRDGSVFRQIATAAPPSTNKHNSDGIISSLPWRQHIGDGNDDGLILHDPNDFDEELNYKTEPTFLPNDAIIVNKDQKGVYYHTPESLKAALELKEHEVETRNTSELFDRCMGEHYQGRWTEEFANHAKKALWESDPTIILHGANVLVGAHYIFQNQFIGKPELNVYMMEELPEPMFKVFE